MIQKTLSARVGAIVGKPELQVTSHCIQLEDGRWEVDTIASTLDGRRAFPFWHAEPLTDDPHGLHRSALHELHVMVKRKDPALGIH